MTHAKSSNVDRRSAFRDFLRKSYGEMDELNGEEARLNPIVLNECNGSFSYPFSQAIIHYIPSDDEQPIRHSFDLDLWYESIYFDLMNVLADETQIKGEHCEKFKCLSDFITGRYQFWKCPNSTTQSNSMYTYSSIQKCPGLGTHLYRGQMYTFSAFITFLRYMYPRLPHFRTVPKFIRNFACILCVREIHCDVTFSCFRQVLPQSSTLL